MPKQDDFINRLDNFTDALEDLVEILKEQQKTGPTEVMNAFFENLDADKISMIAENLEQIKENTKDITSNQEKILSEVKAIKEQKETGLPGTINKKESKNTILEGVKTIMLIAAGVLVIGLAFKIIGRVDFFSVVALGLSIYLLAETFAKIAEMENLSLKNVLKIGLILPIMAASILASGLILQFMPDLNIFQLFTIAAIGITVGLATYFLLKSIEKLNPKNLALVPLLPIILPVVAASLLGAAYILKEMPIVSFDQILSALGVAVALAPIMIAVGFMTKAMEKASITSILLMPLVIPLIAKSVVWASEILVDMVPIDNPWEISKTGLAIGLVTLAMVPTIMLLQKAKLLEPKALMSLAIGVLALPLIATAIVLSAAVFSLGASLGVNFDTSLVPDYDWSLRVGLSLIAFSIPLAIVGLLAMTGVGIPALALGLIATPIIIGGIILSAGIFQLGATLGLTFDEKSIPSYDWTLRVGLAMLTFSAPMIALGLIALTGVGLIALGLGVLAIYMVAKTIVNTAKILGTGDYGNYPDHKWALGVGLSMLAFGIPMVTLGAFILMSFGLGMVAIYAGGKAILAIADTIAKASHILSTGNYDGNYPDFKWSSGVALSLGAFTNAYEVATGSNSFFGKKTTTKEFTEFIITVAAGLVAAAEEFNKSKVSVFDESKVPTKEWAEGVSLSVSAFANAMGVMDNIGSFMGMGGGLSPEEFSVAMKTIVTGIVEAAKVFNLAGVDKSYFDVSKVPSKEWSEGIAPVITSFAELIGVLVEGDIELDDPDEIAMIGDVIRKIAWSIVNVGAIFSKHGDKFGKAPKKEWAEGVSFVINKYKEWIDIDISWSDSFGLQSIIRDISETGRILAKINGYGIPDKVKVENISSLMNSFVENFKNISDNIDNSSIITFKKMGNALEDVCDNIEDIDSDVYEPNGILDKISYYIGKLISVLPSKEKVNPLFYLAKAIDTVSKSLENMNISSLGYFATQLGRTADKLEDIDLDKVNSLYSLGMGLNMLSLVDNVKLLETINVIEAKKKELTGIVEDKGFINSLLSSSGIGGGTGGRTASLGSIDPSDNDRKIEKQTDKEEQFRETLLTHVINIDANMEAISKEQEKILEMQGKNVEE